MNQFELLGWDEVVLVFNYNDGVGIDGFSKNLERLLVKIIEVNT